MTRLTLILILAALTAPNALSAPRKDIVSTAVEAGSFKTLAAALKAADLVKALQRKGPFTVFAPTDAAFAKLPKGTITNLLKPGNRSTLRRILLHHVVSGRIGSTAALQAGKAKSLAGEELGLRLRNGRLRVGEAVVTANDVAASNGVIHVIDRVLIPPAPETARDRLLKVFETAIERGAPLFNAGDAKACTAIYEIAVRAAVELAGEELSGRERKTLSDALRSLPEARDDRARAWLLRNAMDKVFDAPARPAATNRNMTGKTAKKTFKPVSEAKLPAGFPGPGPVGEVVFKSYPRYRAARAEGRNTFWTLFNHIKRNKIAMTAPVEMSMAEGPEGGAMIATDMAFLYANTDLGKTGKDGKVDVVDLEPLRVLSVGIRGPMDPRKVDAAKQLIEKTLKKQGLKRSGEWRLLGYNSPMIPAEKRFWELQAPIAN